MDAAPDETMVLTPLLVGSPRQDSVLFRADETGASFLRKTAFHAPSAPAISALRLFFPHGIPRGAVVAYQSHPGVPTHALLRAWLVHLLLPAEVSWGERVIPIGGCHFGVVYFDFSYRIDIRALQAALVRRLEAAVLAEGIVLDLVGRERIDDIISTCLRRVTIIRCESHVEFLLHLRQLRSIASRDESIRGLIIDSIDSLSHMTKLGESFGLSQTPHICQVVDELANNFRMAVISTQSEAQNRTDFSPPVHLGRHWNKLVTHRFIVSGRPTELHLACVQSPSSALDRLSSVFSMLRDA